MAEHTPKTEAELRAQLALEEEKYEPQSLAELGFDSDALARLARRGIVITHSFKIDDAPDDTDTVKLHMQVVEGTPADSVIQSINGSPEAADILERYYNDAIAIEDDTQFMIAWSDYLSA